MLCVKLLVEENTIFRWNKQELYIYNGKDGKFDFMYILHNNINNKKTQIQNEDASIQVLINVD